MLRARPSVRRFGTPVVYAACTTLLLLRTAPGRVGIDTKQYLFLDPGRLIDDASSMWHPGVAFGTVPHQNIGFLWPMGPFFWLGEQVGLADWVTQRLWLAALLIGAGLGVRWLASEFGITPLGAWVAGLVYAWGPFSLGYVHRTSVLLLPWACLGFLVVFASRAVRRGGWRDPAAFALVVATCGGANATALLLAGLAPLLWVVHLALDREIGWRRALAATGRIGLLSAGVSLWWFVALVVQGRYSLNVLRYTETIDAVARSTSATEVLRGLGYWLFYGRDRLAPWIEPAPAYQTSTALLIATFALPLLGVGALLAVRSRHRSYSASLLVVGVVVAVGAFPWEDPSRLGALAKGLATSTDVGLALRSGTRAVPLVALALALALGSLVAAATRRVRPVGVGGGVLVLLLAFGAFPPLWQGTLVAEDLSRDEAIPEEWISAVRHVDAADDGTRVIEMPGTDLTFHRWGATWEPITPGLTDRPFAARELVPYGGPGSVDLLRALDRRMQDGTIEPSAIAPVARLLGAGDLLLRNDLEYERFRTPRPAILWDVLQRAPGLGETTPFGAREPNVAGPELPLRDEIALGTSPGLEVPPPVAAIEVPGTPPLLHAAPLEQTVVVAGSGEGVVDAAAAGLIDRPGLLLYSATFADDPATLRSALSSGADLLVTDSNRRRAERWRTLRDNTGLTEAAGEEPLVDDESDARLDLFPAAGSDEQSVTVTTGARARATAYGNPVTYTPSERPQLAIDGDESTAWTVGAFADPRGERLVVEFEAPRTVDELRVVFAPSTGRRITDLAVTADGESVGTISSHDGSPASIDLGALPAIERLEFEIVAVDPSGSGGPDAPAVGIAEVEIPGLVTSEAVRVPVDLVRAVDADLDHRLVYVLSRLRSDPAEAVRDDDEASMARIIEVPSPRRFALSGTARIAAAADALVWSIVGASGPEVTASDSLGGDVGSRPWSAVDGDPTTAWQTGFGPQAGRWLELRLPEAVTFDEMKIDALDDADHSVPTALTITAGGAERRVELPTDGDATVTFPALTGDRIRVTVDAVVPRFTRDWYGLDEIEMPVGLTDIDVDGVEPVTLRDRVDDRCRTDLVHVGGEPVGVSIDGAVVDAVLGRALDISACDGQDLLLGGDEQIEAAPGTTTGLDVDRLVLASGARGGPDRMRAPLGEAEAPQPSVTVTQDDDTVNRVVVDTRGQPTMVVLGENRNDGWSASADGVDLGDPLLVDGYANGWILPGSDEPVEVTMTWTPQRHVRLATWASALAAVACAAVVLGARRRSDGHPAPAVPSLVDRGDAGPMLTVRWTLALALACGIGALLVSTVAVACAVAALTAVACRMRWGPIVLAGAAFLSLAAAFGLVVVSQRRNRWRADFDWPTHFLTSHRLAMAAVVLAGAAVLVDHVRRRRGRASGTGSGEARC